MKMLMTAERKFSRVENDLLRAIREANAGDWVTRKEIQTNLGRASFSKGWHAALAKLRDEGYIEIEEKLGASSTGIVSRYRMKG
jgi:hypothetical protein